MHAGLNDVHGSEAFPVATGDPAALPLKDLIRGWQEGLQLMREGGRSRLLVPPGLGYGHVQSGPIPPEATLCFDIVLVAIIPPASPESDEENPLVGAFSDSEDEGEQRQEVLALMQQVSAEGELTDVIEPLVDDGAAQDNIQTDELANRVSHLIVDSQSRPFQLISKYSI